MATNVIRCVHLKTGADGRSHVDYLTLPMGIVQEANAIHFQESPAGSGLDWHTAPHVQYVITLSAPSNSQPVTARRLCCVRVRYCWLPIQPVQVIVGDSSMINPGDAFTLSYAYPL